MLTNNEMPELPKPTKLLRQIRSNGAYEMVAVYMDQEMHDYARAVLAAAVQSEPTSGTYQEALIRLRYALGDPNSKLTVSQLTRRAYELAQKAAKWDEWSEAQNRIETEMPPGWSFVIKCSPGDWDAYLTDPDGERINYDRACDTLAQQMGAAVDEARAAASAPTLPAGAKGTT